MEINRVLWVDGRAIVQVLDAKAVEAMPTAQEIIDNCEE